MVKLNLSDFQKSGNGKTLLNGGKSPAGRKKKSPEDRQSKHIGVTLTIPEHEKLERCIEEELGIKIPTGTYIRRVLKEQNKI